MPRTTAPRSRANACSCLARAVACQSPAILSQRPIHYRYDRCITVREMARLHGFPDWFRLHATKWHGARQIGNAVPPPLARAIAAEVAKSLEITPARPHGMVELGDPGLLKLDISGAAAHFGVDPLPSRRDRKSGVKKRRQVDIEAERVLRRGVIPTPSSTPAEYA